MGFLVGKVRRNPFVAEVEAIFRIGGGAVDPVDDVAVNGEVEGLAAKGLEGIVGAEYGGTGLVIFKEPFFTPEIAAHDLDAVLQVVAVGGDAPAEGDVPVGEESELDGARCGNEGIFIQEVAPEIEPEELGLQRIDKSERIAAAVDLQIGDGPAAAGADTGAVDVEKEPALTIKYKDLIADPVKDIKAMVGCDADFSDPADQMAGGCLKGDEAEAVYELGNGEGGCRVDGDAERSSFRQRRGLAAVRRMAG